MKLIISDSGDASVGIFPRYYEIDCPFDSDIDQHDKDVFMQNQLGIYNDFCEGRLTAYYS